MVKRLENQIVIVTGAGRGIGKSIVLHCAQEGAHVVLAARTGSELQETANEIKQANGEATIIPTDVAIPRQVDQLIERTESEIGPIDTMVNNAGRLGAVGPMWEADPDNWWKDVEVNVFGVFLCCRAAIQKMNGRNRGRIINMAGGGTSSPFPFASAYGCSKAAVMRITDTLAIELDQTDSSVKVFAITPGFVRTAMTESFMKSEDKQKWMDPLVQRLEQGDDVPPDLAAKMVVEISAGNLDNMHGRFLISERDLDQLDLLRQRSKEDEKWRMLGVYK